MKTLVVPDVHVPFQCPKAEKLLHKLIKRHRPEKIVFLGDVADVHALTTHPKITHWRDNLEEELFQTHAYLARVRKTAGAATKIIYIKGNHEHRWERMVDKCVPHLSVTRGLLPHFLDLKGLNIDWIADAGQTPVRSPTGCGKVRFMHGHEIRGGSPFPARHALKIAKLLGESIHIGHTHRFGIMGFTTPTGTHFAMEAGFVADRDSAGMLYGFPQTDWLMAYTLYDSSKKESPLPEIFWV